MSKISKIIGRMNGSEQSLTVENLNKRSAVNACKCPTEKAWLTEEDFFGKKELVNHPQHYQTKNGLEVIDVIEAFELGFNLGNVIKYVLRCGKKDADVQELEKAKWYLEREIQLRKN